MTTSDPTVANIILEQLGGARRLGLMIGAKDFLYDSKSLEFTIGRNAMSVNKVKVTLDPSDTYTVTCFGRFNSKKLTRPVKSEVSDIYVDVLRENIERAIGMYLSLGTMGRAC